VNCFLWFISHTFFFAVEFRVKIEPLISKHVSLCCKKQEFCRLFCRNLAFLVRAAFVKVLGGMKKQMEIVEGRRATRESNIPMVFNASFLLRRVSEFCTIVTSLSGHPY
jgi:hypothetical protein